MGGWNNGQPTKSEGSGTLSAGVPPPEGATAPFDGRNGCRKCFCVTFDKSNKTAVSGEDFL